MLDAITDTEIRDWETDLANGYTVDTQLGIAFLRLAERLRDTQEQLGETEARLTASRVSMTPFVQQMVADRQLEMAR